jgi:uncharacterized repeat protein (TIGR01451 family)
MLTYTLSVTNTGSELATDIVITDVVPVSTSLVIESLAGSEGVYSGTAPGGIVTWTTGISLSLNQMLTRTFSVLVDSGLTDDVIITNTVYVSSTADIGGKSDLIVQVKSSASGVGDIKIYLPIILID